MSWIRRRIAEPKTERESPRSIDRQITREQMKGELLSLRIAAMIAEVKRVESVARDVVP